MWVKAHWHLYDMVFYDVPRLLTFQRIVALGIGKRDAAKLIQDCEREG